MAESKKDVGKKLNTSAKPGSSTPPKRNKADADDFAKPKSLLDELDSKLDDLFTPDAKETTQAEKRQVIQSPLDDVKETPKVQKTVTPDKDKADVIKTRVPATKKPEPFQPVHSNETAEAKKKTDIIKPTTAEAADKLKTKAGLPDKLQIKKQRPTETATEKKPADKRAAGKAQKEKPIIIKTKPAPIPEKASPAKFSRTQAQDKPVGLNKEPEKPAHKEGKKKHALLKLALAGIIFAGGVLALLAFFQTPDPAHQSQPVAAPTAHKIIKSPEKAPETKTTPQAVQSVPQRPEVALIQPKAPPAAVPADDKKPALSVKPEINAADEIKYFLQEWKTAWEKSAGEKGDTDAFMSFYSDDFTSAGLDKNRWRQDKAEKNRRKEWIRIELEKINIVGPLPNGRYEAGFIQVYQSSNYADTSDQILILKKEASGWKIVGTKPQTLTSYPYSIHDGSYRTLPSAREAVEAYRKTGLEAYWTAVNLGEKGIWYRIFIGYYTNPESARRIIEAKALNDVRPEETPYANLIGTYASEDDLQRQRRLIAEGGYSPYVIVDDNGNLNLYVGAHVTLKNAEKFSDELSARGILSRVVQR